MKAIAVTPRQKDSMDVIDVPEPQIGVGDVLVKVARVGICGTDVELKAGDYGEAPVGSSHLVIGHESFGQVAQTGSEGDGIAVVITWWRPSGGPAPITGVCHAAASRTICASPATIRKGASRDNTATCPSITLSSKNG